MSFFCPRLLPALRRSRETGMLTGFSSGEMFLKEQVESGITGNFADVLHFISERRTKHFPQHKIWWVRFSAGVKQHSRLSGGTPVWTSWGVHQKSRPRQLHLPSCALGLVLFTVKFPTDIFIFQPQHERWCSMSSRRNNALFSIALYGILQCL